VATAYASRVADRSYIEGNARELGRLRGLVGRLDEDQLARPMDAGWTVASVLAHMAFWDWRVVACLAAWGADGSGSLPTYHDDAVDWINDSAKPIFLALTPRAAAGVVIDAAEAADRAVAGMSDDLLARNEQLGLLVNPDRADHRGEHLDELERMFPAR
jgi:Mycothiol maleylpyruvate isomerase N-terminal domain